MSKKILVKKIFVKKIFQQKKICQKKIFVQKIFCPKKILSKKILTKKKNLSKKNFCQKQFLSKKNFIKKRFLPKKIFYYYFYTKKIISMSMLCTQTCLSRDLWNRPHNFSLYYSGTLHIEVRPFLEHQPVIFMYLGGWVGLHHFKKSFKKNFSLRSEWM